jgi:uncharacterized protein involved in exopolysaccharide biosynthesis
MIDKQSTPRRSLDIEDYIDILRRNFKWLIGPAFAGLVISTVVAFALEDTYVSEALLRIVPQQISPELIKDINAQDVAERLNGMIQNIESRTSLANIINTFGLYKNQRNQEPMQDVIDTMQKAINIKPVLGVTSGGNNNNTLPALQVSFRYHDRYLAQRVCEALVARFLDSSAESSFQTQVIAQQFLQDEFDRAKRDLEVIEQKLSDYRKQNIGHLPEEMQGNVSEMNALEGRLSTLAEQATRNTEQRMMLESELRIAKDRLAAIKSPQSQAHNEHVAQLDREIEQLQTNIESMRDRYTEDYPGLQAAKDQLAVLTRERDKASKEKPAESNMAMDETIMTREKMDAQGAIQQLETALKNNSLEEKQIQTQTAQVNIALKTYEGRVEEVPPGAREYAEMLRDEGAAKERYTELQVKLEKAAVSMDLERRKAGQTIELLDQASLPESPSAPKRLVIVPIGAVVGLVLGIIFIALREIRDTSLKNLKDARLYTQLSVLGSIPLLENDVVVQRRKQMTWVSWAAATVVGLAIMAGSVLHHYLKRA